MNGAAPILVFGGTFDPPTLAHVLLPPFVSHALGGAWIVYVPTSSNPLKPDAPADARHRLAMLEIALEGMPRAEICTLEVFREGPSYTVDTLETLRGERGEEAELRLLLGTDAAVSFLRWRTPARILELATPIVMLRPPGTRSGFVQRLHEAGFTAEAVASWSDWTIDVPDLPLSSTEARRRAAAGEDMSALVPPGVARYIDEHDLYQPRESDVASR